MRLSLSRGLAAMVVVAALGVVPASASEDINEAPSRPYTFQTQEEAEAADLVLVAEANDWTFEEAAANHHAAEVVGDIAATVAAERPNSFIGSKLSSVPGDAPTLYIKGSADRFVRHLVGSAPIDVRLRDEQPFSFAELEERKLRVHRALETVGFLWVATSFSLDGRGEIKAGVTRQAGLPSNPVEILSHVPVSLRGDVKITVHNDPLAVDEHAFGGNWVRDDGAYECTSGWSVTDGSTSGVTTAGHCTGINEIVEPGVGVWGLTYETEHRGQWGDVEWKSSSHIEPPQFYSSSSTIRNVSDLAGRYEISEREPVCLYGRSSNVRDCSLEVLDVSQACTNSGIYNNRLVMMNGDVGIGGDSGGGWSFGGTAYGSHKGNCSPDLTEYEVFSVASLYDEALGVTVKIAP